jgi:GT2 family glycosyltransferase
MTVGSKVRPPGGIEVIVPSYRRPDHLRRCLQAISVQSLRPERVIVVTRADDPRSRVVTAEHAAKVTTPLKTVVVDEPGVIAAITAGVAASSAPLVAFTDDDARPRPDWLEQMVRRFAGPAVGGVGGRDVIPEGECSVPAIRVGRFSSWGRLHGNHHLGCGPAREVHVLKGVNMGFRADALALPRPGILRGDGAQVHYEVLMCRWASLQGWRLVYDPAVVVDHDSAPRPWSDRRGSQEWVAVSHAAYNFLTAVSALRPAVPSRVLFALAVGDSGRPGLVRAGIGLIRGEFHVAARFWPAAAGYTAALRDGLVRRRRPEDPVMVTAVALRGSPDSGFGLRRAEGSPS